MRYCIDIDGTICAPTVGRGYEKAHPTVIEFNRLTNSVTKDTTSSSLLQVLWVGSVVIQTTDKKAGGDHETSDRTTTRRVG